MEQEVVFSRFDSPHYEKKVVMKLLQPSKWSFIQSTNVRFLIKHGKSTYIAMKLIECDECGDPVYVNEATLIEGYSLCPECASFVAYHSLLELAFDT